MGLDNPLHIAFLLVILLLVFGAKRLPEIGRSLGEGMRGFKSSIEGSSAPAGIGAAAAPSAMPGLSPAQQAETVPVAAPAHAEPTVSAHAEPIAPAHATPTALTHA
jgi:sec-independent protein translocase protein TatA